MKMGILLHPERGMDPVFEEARQADRQGFDSIWVADHLMNPFGDNDASAPFDSLALMTALGAVTTRTRVAWAMLNISFRSPAVLAKTLATIDHITKGRLIAALGSGWFLEEYAAYDIPMIDDHGERAAAAAEVVGLFKKLWTQPAPEKITYEGKHVRVRNLPFNPAPYQKPHPPIWWGGDSEASLKIVKNLADGWVMLTSGNKKRLGEVLGAPDWPKRPLVVVKNVRIFVRPTRDEAIAEARAVFDRGGRKIRGTFEQFLEAQVVGVPDECIRKLKEIESWGINYFRVECEDAAHQERVARLILPLLDAAPRELATQPG